MPVAQLRQLINRAKGPAAEPFPEPVGSGAVITSLTDPPCLVLFGYAVLAVLVWAAWAVRRSARRCALSARRAAPRRPGGLSEPLLKKRADKDSAAPCVQSLTDEQGSLITFEGYTGSCFGALASLLVPATSFAFLAVFLVVLYDYYYGCEWVWPDQLCYVGTFALFGSFETNSYVFMVLWSLGTCWFGLLIGFGGGQMGNLFRLPSPLHKAHYVHVTVEEKREALSTGHSRVLAVWEWTIRLIRRFMGMSGLPSGVFALSRGPSQTVPLRFDKDIGLQFVEFRCVRYVLDPKAKGFTKYNPGEALQGGYEIFTQILEAGGLRADGASAGFAGMPAVDEMLRRAGPNRIPFEVDTWGMAVTEEFASFFFLYQFSIYAVCMWFSYWHYTLIALAVAGVSGLLNVSMRIANQQAIKGMMEQSSRLVVKRGGQEQELDAAEVVPGDLVKVGEGGWLVPCDLLLLQGAAVCDESTLTGESMPVQRLAPTEPLTDAKRLPAKHVLVAGTTVLQVSGECWAVATHTGINTQKGQLLLLILYPPKLLFKYDEQLAVVFSLLIVYAIGVMISSMKMMYERYASDQELPLTATWAIGIFTCSCVLPTMLHIVLCVGQVVAAQRLKRDEHNVFCAAPKRIPLAGKVRAVCFDKTGTLTESSLKFFGVHCVAPAAEAEPAGAEEGARGPFGGRLFQAAGSAQGALSLEPEPRSQGWALEVLCGLASAHSLSPFAGSETGVVGNAVEVNMFQATGWALNAQDPSEVRSTPSSGAQGEHSLRIRRRFDFSHSTMTMSAVVEHAPSGQCGVYCKGSFEQVMQRCVPSSVPPGFAATAQAHAFSGMYVLALAARALPAGGAGAAAAMTREETEKDLLMLGLLLFKNPLRPDTRDTIERLREGDVRSVMITGDAAGTAIRIAKEAAMVQPRVPVLLGDVSQDAPQGVCWRCQDEDLTAMNELLLGNDWLTWRRNYKQWRAGEGRGARGEANSKVRGKKKELGEVPRVTSWPTVHEVQLAEQTAAPEDADESGYLFSTEELVLSRLFEWCELAVTQRAFEWLSGTQCSPDLRRVLLGSRQANLKKGRALSSGKGDSSLAWELLTSIRIFARMTPSGKVSVVEGLMSQSLIVAMVGDGGNDSGALRSAHVGLALSNATSATVVAPFTTNRASVAPIADLLREGRAALATSFSGYKYSVHYGLMNSFFRFQIFWYGCSFPMSARYFQDLVGFLSFSWAISQALPAKALVHDRPTSSLFSVFTVSSVLGMWILNIFFMRWTMDLVTSHEEFQPFPVHLTRVTEWWKLSRNWEATTMFFIYTFQLFWSAVVFSFGYLFRLPWYQNLMLLGLAVSGFGFLAFLIVSSENSATLAFHLVYEPITDREPYSPELPCPAMPLDLRMRLLGRILTNMLCVGLFEKGIVQGTVGRLVRDKCRRLSKHVTLRL